MQDYPPVSEELPPSPSPTAKGHIVLTWLVIWALVCGIVYLQSHRSQKKAAPAPGPELSSKLWDTQGKYLLGAARQFNLDTGQILRQLRAWRSGAIPMRIRYAIIAGELQGPEQALQELALIKEAIAESEKKEKAEEHLPLLQQVYRDHNGKKYDVPSLTEAEKEKLTRHLGWHGRLALYPEQSPDEDTRAAILDEATATTAAILTGALGGFCLTGVGLIGFIVFIILWGTGKIRTRLLEAPSRGAVYAETFAVWLILFWGINLLAGFLLKGKLPIPPLLFSSLVSLVSMVALFWPALRGQPWSETRMEIGWHGGTNPLLEVLCGIATYIMNLPLIIVGVLIVLLIVASGGLPGARDGGMPSHPLNDYIPTAGPGTWLQIVFVACIMAPLVEETFFRGALHRHLRAHSRQWGFALSFVGSALLNSFLFAVIHPQGLLGVPVLMAVAFGFSFAREWRGSLIPCMVAHAIHNGVIVLIVYALMG